MDLSLLSTNGLPAAAPNTLLGTGRSPGSGDARAAGEAFSSLLAEQTGWIRADAVDLSAPGRAAPSTPAESAELSGLVERVRESAEPQAMAGAAIDPGQAMIPPAFGEAHPGGMAAWLAAWSPAPAASPGTATSPMASAALSTAPVAAPATSLASTLAAASASASASAAPTATSIATSPAAATATATATATLLAIEPAPSSLAGPAPPASPATAEPAITVGAAPSPTDTAPAPTLAAAASAAGPRLAERDRPVPAGLAASSGPAPRAGLPDPAQGIAQTMAQTLARTTAARTESGPVGGAPRGSDPPSLSKAAQEESTVPDARPVAGARELATVTQDEPAGVGIPGVLAAPGPAPAVLRSGTTPVARAAAEALPGTAPTPATAARIDPRAPMSGMPSGEPTAPSALPVEAAAPLRLPVLPVTMEPSGQAAAEPLPSVLGPGPAAQEFSPLPPTTVPGPTQPAGALPVAMPVTELTLPTPAHAPEFAEALGVQVSLLASDGIQEAELHLNPAEMGPISVRIALDGQRAQVDFGVDSAATRAIVEAGLPELAAAMREAGLTLTGGGVSQHARGDGAAAQGGRPGEGSHQPGGGHGRSPGRETAAGEDVPAARPRSLRINGHVDLYA